jgi:hypothetical protein
MEIRRKIRTDNAQGFALSARAARMTSPGDRENTKGVGPDGEKAGSVVEFSGGEKSVDRLFIVFF